jgi:hypothetical protein|tara:strand:- start:107735 stop:108301 length:567 start_codon:yes stop_codon:yes gene_type:complete
VFKNFTEALIMKKKIFLALLAFLAIHFFTWSLWGDKKLLQKGFTVLENNAECSDTFSRQEKTENYDESGINYKVDRVYIDRMSRINNADSVKNITVNGSLKQVFGYKESIFENFDIASDSTNTIYQLLIVSKEWIPSNPYLQDATYSCWVLGTDYDISYNPYLIWVFYGWTDISNTYFRRLHKEFFEY